jgi:iron(III) transport system ATP-binding protein
MNSIQLENISFEKKQQKILQNISFELDLNQNLSILGHSGSGKSSMLRIISGLEIPNGGKVFLNEKLVSCVENKKVKHFTAVEKRGVGFVFQDLALFPHLTVLQNILFGMTKLKSKKEKLAVAESILKTIEMIPYAERYPHELSGGQKQRVALARSLAPNPSLVLLDEPFSSLDQELRTRLCKYTKNILQKSNVPGVLVTHDVNEALYFGDKILILNSGKIEHFGTPHEILDNPKTPFCATFVAGYYKLPQLQHLKDLYFHPKFLTVVEQTTAKENEILFEAKIASKWRTEYGWNIEFTTAKKQNKEWAEEPLSFVLPVREKIYCDEKNSCAQSMFLSYPTQKLLEF